MGPDSAEHLEILEEFGPSAASAPLQSIPHTCTKGKECEDKERDGRVFTLYAWNVALKRLHTTRSLTENTVPLNVKLSLFAFDLLKWKHRLQSEAEAEMSTVPAPHIWHLLTPGGQRSHVL